jgi:hypothetical protein
MVKDKPPGWQPKDNLKPIKPGEVRNPRGVNGWTKMRERYRERLDRDLDMLSDVLIAEAKSGNITALKACLGPVIDIVRHELVGNDGAPIDFAAIASRAMEESE